MRWLALVAILLLSGCAAPPSQSPLVYGPLAIEATVVSSHPVNGDDVVFRVAGPSGAAVLRWAIVDGLGDVVEQAKGPEIADGLVPGAYHVWVGAFDGDEQVASASMPWHVAYTTEFAATCLPASTDLAGPTCPDATFVMPSRAAMARIGACTDAVAGAEGAYIDIYDGTDEYRGTLADGNTGQIQCSNDAKPWLSDVSSPSPGEWTARVKAPGAAGLAMAGIMRVTFAPAPVGPEPVYTE